MNPLTNIFRWLGIGKARDSHELTTLLQEAEKLALSFPVDYIGVEHVFLSFRSLSPDHAVSRALAAMKVNLAAFYVDLDAKARVDVNRPIPAKLPLTPRLTVILDHARKTARLNKHSEVQCIHLLYSIGIERKSLPASLLLKRFIDENPQYTSMQFNADLFTGYLAFSDKGKAPVWRMSDVYDGFLTEN